MSEVRTRSERRFGWLLALVLPVFIVVVLLGRIFRDKSRDAAPGQFGMTGPRERQSLFAESVQLAKSTLALGLQAQ